MLYTDGEAHKRKLLDSIISHGTAGQVIVFTATKRGAENLSAHLMDLGTSAIALHGDMRQNKRLQAIKKVRDNHFKVLVATDVAARGIDIAGITHVVNYDIPRTADDYTHRIGRTGRAGAEGTALTFVGHSERNQLRLMERFLGHPLEVSIIPGLEPSNKPAKSHAGSSRRSGQRGGTRGRDSLRGQGQRAGPSTGGREQSHRTGNKEQGSSYQGQRPQGRSNRSRVSR